MRYSKSKIMKRAWELRRIYGAWTFSVCLKRAWLEAKRAIAESEVIAKIKKFENNMSIKLDGITFTLRRWTKAGYDRVYINDGTRKGRGYVDLKNRENHAAGFTSSKVAELILGLEF